jgi:hypothetical protein
MGVFLFLRLVKTHSLGVLIFASIPTKAKHDTQTDAQQKI